MIRKFMEGSRILTALGLFVILAASPAFSQIKSAANSKKSLADYPSLTSLSSRVSVGDKVRLVGTQFSPSEAVTVVISEVEIDTGLRAPFDSATVYANDQGSFVFEWPIPSSGRYTFSAKGSISNVEVSRIVDSGAATPDPVFWPGNPDCKLINFRGDIFPTVNSDYGIKFDYLELGANSGTYPFVGGTGITLTAGQTPDPNNTVTFNTVGNTISWSSTRPVNAVIVKGGPNANVYPYNGSLGDAGPLTTPGGAFGVSHLEFCYDPFATVIVKKHASPPSLFQYDFTTTNLPIGVFSLVDSDVNSDPMQMILTSPGTFTVTEANPEPYTLTSINCVSQSGSSTINSQTVPTANVTIADGDTVTCTFNNDFLTAAEAVIQGRVLSPDGRPLGGAIVTGIDGSGNVRTARTNMFGRYEIRELEAGTALMLDVRHKGYIFGSRFVEVSGENMNVDFIGINR
ncbi:MAG: carboxypeptidase regulatory-like domain-containing protein [Acidobacteriota bacterium]|nr:MAG: carboxypeptidase regulatory-like domain-containing protein [Acidobacteriota bacterium]